MKKTGISADRSFRPSLALALVPVMFLLTGCPHNDYTVQLKPHGNGIERTLVFYCADGTNQATGLPNYQGFDPAELAGITNLYRANGVTQEDEIYTVHGNFTNILPGDVGGAGTYTNLATSLGTAGIYAERFRGNDDLAGMAERRLKAADQLTDLLIGWSKLELGHEAGYPRLRHFLDVDFRRDLKNASAYWAEAQFIDLYQTNADQEFIARFGQYLLERGYFQVGELPSLSRMLGENDNHSLYLLAQSLIARKLGVAETDTIPASLAFLANDASTEKSFNRYLVTTTRYRALLKQWTRNKKSQPDLEPPAPEELTDPLLKNLIDFDLFATPDHLTVQLSLPSAPVHSNGHWDESFRQEVWASDIFARTNDARPSFFCFADWAQPNDSVQQKRFGQVVLTGDALTQYCLWRSSIDPQSAREWDDFIDRLQPGADLAKEIKSFRFASESASTNTSLPPGAASPSNFPRALLGGVLP